MSTKMQEQELVAQGHVFVYGYCGDGAPWERANWDTICKVAKQAAGITELSEEPKKGLPWIDRTSTIGPDMLSLVVGPNTPQEVVDTILAALHGNYPVLDDELAEKYKYIVANRLWKSFSISERLEVIKVAKESGEDIPIFAARKDTVPSCVIGYGELAELWWCDECTDNYV